METLYNNKFLKELDLPHHQEFSTPHPKQRTFDSILKIRTMDITINLAKKIIFETKAAL